MDINVLDNLSPHFISYTEAFPLTAINNSYGQRITKHYELELILSGSGQILVDSFPLPVIVDAINIRFPNMVVEGIGGYKSVYIEFELTPSNDIISSFESLPLVNQGISIDKTKNIFYSFSKIKGTPSYRELLLFKSHVFKLLYYIVMNLSSNIQYISNHHDKITKSIQNAIQFIQHYYADEIDLNLIAQNSGYSPYYFCRLFKNRTNYTPIEFLNNYRMNKAKILLITTDYTIENIASKCGYSNYSYFFRRFKMCFNTTPSKYRLNSEKI